jgi:hypothetical protein
MGLGIDAAKRSSANMQGLMRLVDLELGRITTIYRGYFTMIFFEFRA